MSLEELAGILKELGDAKTEVRVVPFPPEKKRIDIGDYFGTSQKFKMATGWEPRTNVRQGLQEMFAYYQANQKHYLGE